MGDPNAILAINSLDRYTTTNIINTNSLKCTWVASTDLISYQFAYGAYPFVGATVTSTGDGWPTGTVTIIDVPGYPFFRIDKLTTLSEPTAVSVIQTYSQSFNANQPVSNILQSQYLDKPPYSNNFTIQSPGALIYGYINKIIISQIQMQYNIPTVCNKSNDTLVIGISGPLYVPITIPYGFYYPDELAAMIQSLIVADSSLSSLQMTVTFSQRDGFTFTSTASLPFYFPDPSTIGQIYTQNFNATNLYKCYKLFGMSIGNALPAVVQVSFNYPIFLYTPYIDIYSDILTNYQNIKDTNTSISKPKGLLARVYLSGTGGIEAVGSTTGIGTAPFLMTADLNNPKVIRWSPDVAVPSIDFQLLDQYGELIPGNKEGFSTEFQMTLLCVEG